ncbi:type IV secretory system conjugative DNA transfer family protein [Nitrospirillum viridazoti]|uniref:Conjugal transfer protein TraG n=1 Tax=Nitrospirillum viridazoti CBAmc TaxID=1441467 RepID=A0A248JNA9_9PROT|nr:type IV secretory system conjugative DNA transfer family protein [Nitrospirillum amazonense]ASG20222.1 hypothetical protein Y958_04855 [Nitrospirillum amazonense CBAmc]TWB26722.1 type IV secretory system conjugative DNA transfer VirD4/TraG family protein [Nitrospirillum amazonense]
MQLPPTDELLLVAGVPPVRAKKARYYEDARFKERILPPPNATTAAAPAVQSADDWSALAIPAASAGAASGHGNGVSVDPANAGIRREPELPEHEEIAPPERSPLSEFDVLDDDPGVDAARASRLRQQVTSNARQATMDPADGLDL